MAAKRRAGKQLTQDNWNDEEEPEEVGVFEKAPEDILKNRVIRRAKRRNVDGSNPEGSSRSLFSGFSGFASNSNGPKSFSFLSNNKTTDAGDQKISNFSFLSKTSNSEDKNNDVSDKPFSFLSNSKLPNGSCSNSKETMFPLSSSSKTANTIDTTNEPSFSIQSKSSKNEVDSNSQSKLDELSKQLKKNDENQSNENNSNSDDVKNPDEIFLQNLRSLNLLCAEWIIKHLNENLSYILTPVFDDYKKYLDQLKEERKANSASSCKKSKIEKIEPEAPATSSTPFKVPDFKESLSKVDFGNSFFNKPLPKPDNEPTQFKFGSNETKSTFEVDKSLKSESSNSFKPISTPMFNFGSNIAASDVKSDKDNETEKPKPAFTFGLNATESSNQFKNPFFAASSIPTNSESNKPVENEGNDDQPPVLEDVSIAEEGSVYDKKCKVFIKKGGNFVDHGVGFLFLKLVGDEKKCQVIVRANNKLANVIINVLLTSNIPLEKKEEKNVMIVCCPTPDAKPSIVLLRVKTAEDADQLLEMMNKYRK